MHQRVCGTNASMAFTYYVGAVVLGGLSLKGYDPHKIMDRNLQALVFSSAVSRFQHRAIEKYQMAILLWQPHIPFFWPICLLNLRGGRSG